MAVAYEIRIKNHSGTRLATLTDGPRSILRSFDFTHVENEPGLAQLEIDGNTALAALIEDDFQVEFWRSDLAIGLAQYLEWEGLIITTKPHVNADGDQVLSIWAAGYLDLLRRRDVWYYAGTAFTGKSGAAETVLKSFVDQNAGPSANSVSRFANGVTSGLSIQADAGHGASWTGARAHKNLLEVAQEIARASSVAIDVIGTGPATFEFRVYNSQRGTDRSKAGLDSSTGLNGAGNAPISFNLDAGNMAEPELTQSHSDEINTVAVLGQGTDVNRSIQVVTKTVSSASPWSRREGTRSATQEGTSAAGLISVGAQVVNEFAAQTRFSFRLLQLKKQAYGKHYFFGDLVTATFKGVTADKKLISVRISASRDHGEDIQVVFADVIAADPVNPGEKLAVKVAGLNERVSSLEAQQPDRAISTANTSNPPTSAQLTSAFGSPATVGAGFRAVLDDNGSHANEYLVWSDGANWWYATGTKAI